MIARHWKGLARSDRAHDYESHLRKETIPALARIPGFIEASILRRTQPEGIEFLVATKWQSLEAIRQFASPDVDAAVVPPEVEAMMISYDRRVAHYEEVEPHSRAPVPRRVV